jgi:hypothetical protein
MFLMLCTKVRIGGKQAISHCLVSVSEKKRQWGQRWYIFVDLLF